MAPDVRTKRVYDPADPGDGRRVLIDHAWPRGVTREARATGRGRARGARARRVSQDTAVSALRLPSMQRSSSA